MRVLEPTEIRVVEEHLWRSHSAVTLPYAPSEYEAYRARLDETDVGRLVLWWQFSKRTKGASCRVVDLMTSTAPHRRTLSFVEGDPCRGYGSVDLRTARGLELVVVADHLKSDLLYIIDGNNRAVAQRLAHGRFQDVPIFLCIHRRIGQWEYLPRHLRIERPG